MNEKKKTPMSYDSVMDSRCHIGHASKFGDCKKLHKFYKRNHLEITADAMQQSAIGFAILERAATCCAVAHKYQQTSFPLFIVVRAQPLLFHLPHLPHRHPNVSMPPPHLHNDVTVAQRLLRTPPIRAFMLKPPPLSSELQLLTSPRPHFVITTSEVQTGALEGTIAMHYLGVPTFTDSDGLSGGLLVTSYAARTHPLHAPTVMADVRVGRYVRDNCTGDWCIITQSHRDHVTRLQYVRVRNEIIRERICLTCDSGVFDKGDILASVLFRCHDKELRTCSCFSSICSCRLPIRQRAVRGLEDAALSVMQEGAACWKGKVRVTVLSQNPSNKDIDECMDVTSSVQPTMDSALASQMARLAIIEKVNSATCVPRPITAQTNATKALNEEAQQELPQPELLQQDAVVNVADVTMDSFDNVFMQSEAEVADHFLVPPENNIQVLEEFPMLPADPSTLPGGMEMCMDGMDLEEDWCSFINSDRDASSGTSGRSSSGPPRSLDISKEEPFPAGPEVSTRKALEDEDFCAGYHGCDVTIAPVRVQTATPAEISPQTHVDHPLQQAQSQILSSKRAHTRPQVLPETSMPQQGYSEQPVLERSIEQQHISSKSGPQQRMRPQSIPQQNILRQRVSQQPISQQAIPVTTSHVFPAHVLPMMPTPQPWQQPFQGPKMTMKQEGLETSPPDSPDDKSQETQHGRKLAPRPAGMNVTDGFIWQMGTVPANQFALAARLEAMEKERKAEERRKKNRQAAARSNARKKDLMDGIRAQIRESKAQEAELRKRESSLQEENRRLRERVGRISLAM